MLSDDIQVNPFPASKKEGEESLKGIHEVYIVFKENGDNKHLSFVTPEVTDIIEDGFFTKAPLGLLTKENKK